ncbi:hypothetical protein Abr02nite_36490 [Paractinoplanes brasiliensis]|nr:hypothetical protein Abr02nite_36490 [Actinoplanes brasiliensis]
MDTGAEAGRLVRAWSEARPLAVLVVKGMTVGSLSRKLPGTGRAGDAVSGRAGRFCSPFGSCHRPLRRESHSRDLQLAVPAARAGPGHGIRRSRHLGRLSPGSDIDDSRTWTAPEMSTVEDSASDAGFSA